MANKKVNIDGVAAAIDGVMLEYSDKLIADMKAAVDATAKEVNASIKAHISFNQQTGNYVRAFAIKTKRESRLNKGKTWYVKAPHYRLTHLLEHGHRNRGGGSTRAYPHIKYGEETAKANLEKRIIKAAGGK